MPLHFVHFYFYFIIPCPTLYYCLFSCRGLNYKVFVCMCGDTLMVYTVRVIFMHVCCWVFVCTLSFCKSLCTLTHCLVVTDQLGIDLVPYIVLLVVPVLGRMSDQNQSVRLAACRVFATLIRLMPLEVTACGKFWLIERLSLINSHLVCFYMEYCEFTCTLSRIFLVL